MTRGRGHPAGAAARQDGPRGRYGLLLVLLIATYLLSAFTTGNWIGVVQLVVFVATGYLALRPSRLPLRTVRLIGAIGVAVSAAAAGLSLTRPSDAAVAAASIWTGLLLLATAVIIVQRILSFPTVTGQSIFAAISAYLILGLMFAAFYAAVALLHGGHFFAGGRTGDSKTYQYFSFTTLTTLGYGDFTAAGNGGQAIAVLEALTGQIFLATLVARLVAAFRSPRPPPTTTKVSRGPRGRRPSSGSVPARPQPRRTAGAARRARKRGCHRGGDSTESGYG